MAKEPKKETEKKKPKKSSAANLIEYIQKVQSEKEAMLKSAEKVLAPLKSAEAIQKIAAQLTTPAKTAEAIQNATNQVADALQEAKDRQEAARRFIALYERDKLLGIQPPAEPPSRPNESTDDDLYDLKKFIPIELNPTTQNYIDKLLDNMGANSNFYNNAVLNLSHFYIFCLHCLMIKLYRDEERFKHLQYLKEIIKKPEHCDLDLEDFEHSVFNGIEREAMRFLFYYLAIDSHSHIFQRNKDIFDARNEIAHFNEQVFSCDRYQDVKTSIESNLSELSQKAYKHTKETLFAEIKAYVKTGSLDDENYATVLEEINQQYYITGYDYEMLTSRLTSHKPKPNYYILKYASDQLGMDI